MLTQCCLPLDQVSDEKKTLILAFVIDIKFYKLEQKI